MKFEFNWPCGLICLKVLMGCHGVTLAEKSKVNLDLWKLLYPLSH